MKSDFRSEVFKLCKSLQKNNGAKKIAALIHDLSSGVEDENTRLFENNLHGAFAYLAKQGDNQFQGYLFVDDNVETLNLPRALKVEHLTKDERALIEQGHRTLTKFVDMCLQEINERSEILSEILNPYFLFKEVNCDPSVKPLLSEDEMCNAANVFKEGKAYKTLINSKFEYIFQNVNRSKLHMSIDAMDKEISKSFEEDISPDLRDFSFKLVSQNRYIDASDAMFSLHILVIALKKSIEIICQLLYEAICGADLLVLNNDNIIHIENCSSNIICKLYKVLVQGTHINRMSDGVRSVLLLDCDPAHGIHIHEFGMITAITHSYTRDMGDTTKYTFATLNEEMIYIHNIINEIIRIGLPDIRAV